MKVVRNILIIVILLGVVIVFFGRMAYKSLYKAPRDKNQAKITELETEIKNGKDMLAYRENFTSQNMAQLYTRSFPLNPVNARLEYQIWLNEMLEFCDLKEPVVTAADYQRMNNGLATQQYRISVQGTMEQLYRFLYEFYWTSFLHRITVLDIQPIENSTQLHFSLVLESLTLWYKPTPQFAYPLTDKLPLSVNPIRKLASGPFKAYSDTSNMELFRVVRRGIDNADYAILTGTPSITGDDGITTPISLWKIETEGKTLRLKIGDSVTIGSFNGTVDDISDDLVILRQNNGFRWVVSLGDRLSDAVAVPEVLF